MIVCPLCEHPQEHGDTCDGCGKQLTPPRPIALPAERIPELESTALPGGAQPVPVERIELAPLIDVPAAPPAPPGPPPAPIPELERTSLPAAGAVAAVPMVELEVTRFEDPTPRTQLSANRACRYCGNVQSAGAMCDRCGMRLPVLLKTTQTTAVPAQWACSECGVKGTPGTRCLACGAVIRQP